MSGSELLMVIEGDSGDGVVVSVLIFFEELCSVASTCVCCIVVEKVFLGIVE